MKRIARQMSQGFFCFMLLSNIFPPSGYANSKGAFLKANQCIEDFPLLGEISREDRTYLGLRKQEATLCQISCKAIWVQVFSIYCPQCQALVRKFDDLYKVINTDPFSRMNVKMVGIGAGCSDYEVKYFRNFYNVRFPLFPDPDFSIHELLKHPKTPFVFLVKQESKKLKILEILDPTKAAQDQFEHLKATLRRIRSVKGTSAAEGK